MICIPPCRGVYLIVLIVLYTVAQTQLSHSTDNLTSGAVSPIAASVVAISVGVVGAGMLASFAPTTIIGMSLVTGGYVYMGQRK